MASDECIVILGNNKQKDWNGAFKDYPVPKKFGRFNCISFDSWDQADAYLRGKTTRKPRLKPGEDLLIIQAAHGGPGGSASCNAGDVSGEEILSKLESYQNRYRVGAIIRSCYSGDLILGKLKRDGRGNQKNLDRLCLVTSSAPGRVSYGGQIAEAPEQISDSRDLEKWATLNDAMISSSAWDSAGVTEYLNLETNSSAAVALTKIGQLVASQPACGGVRGVETARICAEPALDPALMQILVKYSEKKHVRMRMPSWEKEFRTILLAEPKVPAKGESTVFARARWKCLNALFAFHWRGNKENFLYTLPTGTDDAWMYGLWQKLQAFKNSKDFGECSTYEKLLTDYQAEIAENSAANPPRPGTPSILSPHIDNSRLMPVDLRIALKDFVYNGGIERFRKDQADLKGFIGNPKRDETYELTQFAKAISNTSLRGCIDPSESDLFKAKILRNALTARSASSNGLGSADGRINDVLTGDDQVFSTYELLAGFRNASAALETLPSTADQQRRKACREFKF
jgi:hypothetical protein